MASMDHSQHEGIWWLPEQDIPGRPGTLILDRDGVHLNLHGDLQIEVKAKKGSSNSGLDLTEHPVIHGETRNEVEVTLFNARKQNTSHRLIGETSYRPELALLGSHVLDPKFSEVRAEIDQLVDWMDAPPLSEQMKGGRPSFGSLDLLQARTNDADVRVFVHTPGRYSRRRVNVEQNCQVSIVSDGPMDWRSMIDSRIKPFHDFLMLALGTPLAMNGLYLRPWKSREICTAYMQRRYLKPGKESLTEGWWNAPARLAGVPTLLTAEDRDVNLPELVSRWYELHNELRDVMSLLMAPFYAPFIYSEHRFASYFQALEALHAKFYEARDTGKALHAQRVEKAIKAMGGKGLEEDTLSWVKNVLTGRNDKPLRRRVLEVVESTEDVGDYILGVAPNFARNVVLGRTAVSHGGAKPVASESQFWHGEVLLWVMRTRILTESGVPHVYKKAVKKDDFRYAVNQISEV
ncbi:HEPN domain-containing protein [Streptomyces sp. NPDC012935]|uniref:ApeA N-terminal domain 1-containing protein n=1 Tax=Streptomyces sp. NPDC012935 TaxID=3364857 RepID=UPI0036758E60